MRRALVPLSLALIALLGSLGVTFFLQRAASRSLDRVLEERLLGAGKTAALLLDGSAPLPRLVALRDANGLDAAYLLTPALKVVADTAGASGRADLLRTDPSRVHQALEGHATVAHGYALGQLPITTAYFPVRAQDGAGSLVLALEAGQGFEAARGALARALWVGVSLSVLLALVLAGLASLWMKAEAARRVAAERGARGEALSRIAAAAAHEIRNPLSVISGNVELVQLRHDDALGDFGREALRDVLGEVQRLKQLTEDLIDLSADRALANERIDLRLLLDEVARAVKRTHPRAEIAAEVGALSVRGDGGRLRQVLLNLAQNAAQSGAGRVTLRAQRRDGVAAVTVEDDGPGIPAAVRDRLFEPFVTSKANGTGLGLAVSKRLVERHGGELRLLETTAGSTFELVLKAED